MPTMKLRVMGAALALLTLTAVACKGDNKNDGDQQAAPTAPPRPDPAVLARQAADQVEALKTFHFLLEHENGGSPIALNLTMNRAEGDIVKPDSLRADVDAVATQLGNANVKVRVVSIGDSAQITNPFNRTQWLPLPGASKLSDIFDPAAGTTAALRSANNLTITGEDTLNGVKVWKLEGDVDAAALEGFTTIAEPGYTVKGTAWIGQEKPLVHRIRLDGPLGSKDAQNIVRTIDLSKFDEPLTIERPSG
jgi:lipoprotein LprG